MENSYLKRINELAAKAKSVGLTPEEESERAELRQKYIAEFRSSFKEILDSTKVEYPDGRKVPLKYKKQSEKR